MEHWYLVRTKPGRESHVAVQLHQRGLTVYLPLIWASPVNPRASRQRPYFPGYVFTKVDFQTVDEATICWAQGVKAMVKFAEMPAHISDDFVDELQQGLNRVRAVGGMGFDGAWRSSFLPMVTGPFMGFEGIFNPKLMGADRARILLACVEKEYWRQALQSRPAAKLENESTGAKPEQ
jgi:transcriptional antiterminator RfaH